MLYTSFLNSTINELVIVHLQIPPFPDSRGRGRRGEAARPPEQGGGLPDVQLLLAPPASELQVPAHQHRQLEQPPPTRHLRVPPRPLRHLRRHRVPIRGQRGAPPDHGATRAGPDIYQGESLQVHENLLSQKSSELSF